MLSEITFHPYFPVYSHMPERITLARCRLLFYCRQAQMQTNATNVECAHIFRVVIDSRTSAARWSPLFGVRHTLRNPYSVLLPGTPCSPAGTPYLPTACLTTCRARSTEQSLDRLVYYNIHKRQTMTETATQLECTLKEMALICSV